MGIELLERAAEVSGCFLRAERLVDAESDDDPSRGPGYLLTFDVGRILVVADRVNSCLQLRQVKSLDEVASIRLDPLDEEEPWWRLAGDAITRAWPCHEGSGASISAGEVGDIRMQFRREDEKPRFVSLRYEEGVVRVALHDQEKSP
ncbi:MAG: hypothetical protein NZ990_07415 [Myxococcota bacterium]|nr:hypothetical protein [Myxococcota bacterium]